jgi:hypothetical protein
MSDTVVGITARGKDEASAMLKGVAQNMQGLDKAAGIASGGLSSMFGSVARLAGSAGLVALAVTVGKTIFALGEMGMESAQLEAKSRALAGGAEQLETNMRAMGDAVGLAMTKDQQMEASTSLLASKIAKTASEAAELSKVAIWLGDSHQSANERVDGLMRALQTGRTMSLIPYRLDMALLETRVKALKDADAQLTD